MGMEVLRSSAKNEAPRYSLTGEIVPLTTLASDDRQPPSLERHSSWQPHTHIDQEFEMRTILDLQRTYSERTPRTAPSSARSASSLLSQQQQQQQQQQQHEQQ